MVSRNKIIYGLVIFFASLFLLVIWNMTKPASKSLKVGDFAPDFVLKDQHNDLVRLSQFRGSKHVVVYFYPKDDTPGCTAEAKCFRDSYEIFQNNGAEVIGISSDSTTNHIKFAGKHNLPFILLSDPGGKVRELYGVTNTLFMIPGRVTFVIDKQGIVRHIFSSQFNATKHVDEAVEILRKLN